MAAFWKTKSLEQLEGDDWGKPTYDSHVVRTAHAIRKKPVRDLSVEELCLAIRQGMGLRFLLSVAVEKLSEKPLARGDFYPADLLLVTMKVPPETWLTPSLQALHKQLAAIAASLLAKAGELDADRNKTHLPEIEATYRALIAPQKG